MSAHFHGLTLLAVVQSARSRFIYENEALYVPLLEHAVRSLSIVFPNREILFVADRAPVLRKAEALGVGECRHLDRHAVSRRGILVRPHLGPLSPERIRRVHAEQLRTGSKAVSSMLTPNNCNPAWLSCVDRSAIQGTVATVCDDKAIRPYTENEATRAIPGSQWLPESYIPDATIIAFPGEGAHKGKTVYVHDDPLAYTDMPLFYRLPLFWLDEGQQPSMDVDGKAITAFFAGYCSRAETLAPA